VRAAAQHHGAQRVGVIVGTSTSGILQSEIAYRERAPDGALPAWLHYGETHDNASLARYVQAALGLQGPAWVISTACSSGAKAYAAAARLIALGLIDAAVVGGVDTLCMTTLYGFHSLELLSTDVCRPWDARRNGLSLGEGASFALLQRDDTAPAAWLLGCGESSDGHHMSSPHPEGAGAADAMRGALADASLQPDQVDYINLHGTGTRNNDAAEDAALFSVFGSDVPASSTKGLTGHALGAAGAIEAAIALLALRHGFMPPGVHCEQPDPALRARYQRTASDARLAVAASNSFGFGGSNSCLLFGVAR
jgi:3-oxoacyl-[acyl-carrier-protein] synthase-1